MGGRHDQLTPPRMAMELKSEIPNAYLVIFDEGGHGLYWELPERLNRTVLDFLRGQLEHQLSTSSGAGILDSQGTPV